MGILVDGRGEISRRRLLFGARAAMPVVEGDPMLAVIAAHCLAARGITCRLCEEACEAEAIRFRLQTAGRALALVDAARCTGCGDCHEVCPGDAVTLIPREETR